MTKNDRQRRIGCPVTYALDLFGDRWSLIIFRDMALKGYQTYGEFFEGCSCIATNVLADRLLNLEAAGIVRKVPDPDDGRRHRYLLTDKGIDLIPMLLELISWSAHYDSKSTANPNIVARIRADRDGLAEEFRARVHARQDDFAEV